MTSEPDRVGIVNFHRSLNWLTEPRLGLFCLLPASIRAVACQLPVRSRCSCRQLLAGLLADDVVGVPVRPVHIVLAAGPFLVLAVRGCRTSERGRELSRRGEGRVVGVHPSGQSRGDLLKQPAVAVRIFERGERAVAAVLGIRTANPDPPKQIGLVRADVRVAGAVEHLADLDAATEQLVAGGLDVGDDQVQSLGGAGCRRGHVLAEDDRGRGAKGSELDHAEVVTGGEVGIEPPTQADVKALGRSTSETGMTTTSSFISTVRAVGVSIAVSLRT